MQQEYATRLVMHHSTSKTTPTPGGGGDLEDDSKLPVFIDPSRCAALLRPAHATATFKGRIWLTGGRSKVYSRWDLERSQRRADVWWTENGRDWVQEKQLLGDFQEQNSGVLIPGPVRRSKELRMRFLSLDLCLPLSPARGP